MSITPAIDVSAIEVSKAAAVGEKADEVDNTEKLLESLNALSVIRNGLARIQQQQARDRHRLDLHSEANEANYRDGLWGSVFETVIFIFVAIFQVRPMRTCAVCLPRKPHCRVPSPDSVCAAVVLLQEGCQAAGQKLGVVLS